MNKGQDAVDACVDFLKFLSAPENNAKMVNDLGFALPLNVADNDTELFSSLSEQYERDMKAENRLLWSAVNTFNSFGQEFADTYEKGMGEFYGENHRGENSYIIDLLQSKLPLTVNEMIEKYGWSFNRK